MPALAVTVPLDPPKQCLLGIIATCEAGAMDKLVFHEAEEAFHRSMVETVAFAAHRRCEAMPFQHRLVGRARILHFPCSGGD